MKLSRMQDIGGCRAVLSTVEHVDRLTQYYLKEAQFKHEFINKKDYIEKPKQSGYRSVHLVYKYRSDRSTTYNGLQLELQFRSRLQHAWATAVETVGTFLKQSLKASQGSEEWLEFFRLIASGFALREGCSLVPGTPTSTPELLNAISEAADGLRVVDRLQSYGAALETVGDGIIGNADYYLLILEPADDTVTVLGYKRRDLHDATERYLVEEARISAADSPGAEVVLVSAGSLGALKQAYPNYFLDTQVFVDELTTLISA